MKVNRSLPAASELRCYGHDFVVFIERIDGFCHRLREQVLLMLEGIIWTVLIGAKALFPKNSRFVTFVLKNYFTIGCLIFLSKLLNFLLI